MSSERGAELQPRDLDLLSGLFHCRIITLAQAAAIYFDGRSEAAKKRIQKLKAAGLIAQRARKSYQPSTLFLTSDGIASLRDHGLLHNIPILGASTLKNRLQVSELTLRHELAVMDVKAALYDAIRSARTYAIAEFSTWPLLFQFTVATGSSSETVVKPDGLIRIHEESADGAFEHTFFLELDRGTESDHVVGRKALCYLDYYQSGGLAERFGRPRSEYKDFPFRVLMIFRTAERRNNISERLLTQRPPILTQVWLSTQKEVLTDPLGPIWIRPRDYREATDGTAYPMTRHRAGAYRREADRERMVEAAIMKLSLLASESPSGPPSSTMVETQSQESTDGQTIGP